MFTGALQVAEAVESGACWTSWIHKSGAPASFGANRWCDLTMGAGTPKYNAYIGSQLTATALQNAGNDGIYLGPNPPAGQKRYLHRWIAGTVGTSVPATVLLADYVLHYPLIDGDDTAEQVMDNTVTLPRHTTGEGLRMMAVCTTPMTANAVMTVNYTNQAGVAGRISTSALAFNTVVGALLSSGNTSASANAVSPFLPFDNGDTGVRSIESVTLTSASGGFFALVLVKPITNIVLRETRTYRETYPLLDASSLSSIENGAYLGMLLLTAANGTPVTFRGALDFVWG